eukprot:PhF_6_TR1431/c0_g1_i1/m.2527
MSKRQNKMIHSLWNAGTSSGMIPANLSTLSSGSLSGFGTREIIRLLFAYHVVQCRALRTAIRHEGLMRARTCPEMNQNLTLVLDMFMAISQNKICDATWNYVLIEKLKTFSYEKWDLESAMEALRVLEIQKGVYDHDFTSMASQIVLQNVDKLTQEQLFRYADVIFSIPMSQEKIDSLCALLSEYLMSNRSTIRPVRVYEFVRAVVINDCMHPNVMRCLQDWYVTKGVNECIVEQHVDIAINLCLSEVTPEFGKVFANAVSDKIDDMNPRYLALTLEVLESVGELTEQLVKDKVAPTIAKNISKMSGSTALPILGTIGRSAACTYCFASVVDPLLKIVDNCAIDEFLMCERRVLLGAVSGLRRLGSFGFEVDHLETRIRKAAS